MGILGNLKKGIDVIRDASQTIDDVDQLLRKGKENLDTLKDKNTGIADKLAKTAETVASVNQTASDAKRLYNDVTDKKE